MPSLLMISEFNNTHFYAIWLQIYAIYFVWNIETLICSKSKGKTIGFFKDDRLFLYFLDNLKDFSRIIFIYKIFLLYALILLYVLKISSV